MRPKEVVEEKVHGNEVIGAGEGVETSFGTIPGFELTVKGLDDIVGDPVVEVGHANMPSIVEEQGNRLNIGAVAVRNNRRTGGAEPLPTVGQNRMSGAGITVGRKIEIQGDASFGVQNNPKIIADATDFDISFIAMPFIGAGEIELTDSIIGNGFEDASKLKDPFRDRDVRDLNLMLEPKEFSNLTGCSILGEVEIEGSQNQMQRMAHSLEIRFAEHLS